MTTYHQPTAKEAISLFQAIEKKFPHATIGDDKWYLVALSALIGVEPDHAATLYTYLINKPQFSSSDSRKALIRRLRECLFENIPIQGVCKPLEAVIAITKVEREEDKDYSYSRQNWQRDLHNLSRGDQWLETIYKHNIKTIDEMFAAHKDIIFVNHEITYGLYLSDMSILGPVDTEMVVLSGIMIQNLPTETAWHLRGTRRVGVASEDVEVVQQCVEMAANFGGVSLHKVPRVEDIKYEV